MPARQDSDRAPIDCHLLVQNHGKGVDNPDDALIRLIRAYYYGFITHIDRNVGKIIDAIDRQGLTAQTLIVFMSDHGELLGDHYAWGKRSFYEGSARVPFLMSWPGQLPAGKTRDHFVSGCDLVPTFLTVAGAAHRVPSNVNGRDLIDLCRTSPSAETQAFIGQYSTGRNSKLMLRWDDWKYCYFANGAREQLFNLQDDPDELFDQARDQPELCKESRFRLVQHFSEFGPHRPLDQSGNELLAYPFVKPPFGEINHQRAIWPKTEPTQ